MKKVYAFILLAVMVMSVSSIILGENTSAVAMTSYEEIFAKDKVIDIKIEISDEDLESIYANPEKEEYHSATITVDGVTAENIGIRTKGNSSLNSVAKSDSDRYSYRIKFNKYVKGQKLLGLDEMVINNMFSDSSYMREYLSYEAMREAGMDAPLAVFANIYINGELKGFYLAVEAIEDSFLNRTMGNNDGNLYKQEQGSTLLYSANSDYASSELKIGEDTEKTALKNMIKVLNEKGDYESVLDVESALQLIAANTVLGSYDSYNGNFAHNYYLYEQSGVFTAIPWDYNMSFGGFGQGGTGWSVSLDTPVSGAGMEQRPLIKNLLEVPEYKEMYLEYVKEFTAYLEKMPERVNEIAKIIRQYVEKDPTKFTTVEKFESSIIYAEEAERTSQEGGGQGGMGQGGFGQQNTQLFEGLSMETIQKAMEIIRAAGTNELTEEQISSLHELGITDEQIAALKAMSEGGRGGMRPGGMGGNGTNQVEGTPPPVNGGAVNENGETSTRGNMGGGFGGMNTGQRPEGMMAQQGENGQPMTPPQEGHTQVGQRPGGGNMGGGMGMGGGSIITYSVKRLENINTQLNGNTEEKEITVMLKGNKLSFDTVPVIENGRTLVPLRAIFEALGMEVLYDNGLITAKGNGYEIALTVDSTQAYVNSEEKTLDVPSKIINQRTFVPLRFIGEATGLTVSYDAETKTVSVN